MTQTRVHLTVEELAERERVSKRTVNSWRQNGVGPPYRKLCGRVLYELEAVIGWENENTIAAVA